MTLNPTVPRVDPASHVGTMWNLSGGVAEPEPGELVGSDST